MTTPLILNVNINCFLHMHRASQSNLVTLPFSIQRVDSFLVTRSKGQIVGLRGYIRGPKSHSAYCINREHCQYGRAGTWCGM